MAAAIHQVVKRLFQSRLSSNLFNQFFLYGFSHLIPIILIPFLINTIGIEKYGLLNFALAFSFYFQLVNEFGFDLSNVRHVVNNRENKVALSRILSGILSCKALLVVVTFMCYGAIVLSVGRFREDLLLYGLAFLRLIGIVIAPFWLFQSMEDIKYVTRVTIPVKILCLSPVFWVVKSEGDFVWVMFFYMLECMVSGILALWIALHRYGLVLQKVSWNEMKFYFRDSWPFFLSTALMRIYKNSNAVVLGFFCGEASTGIYTAAEKLHNAYSSFMSPILSKVFYPYFSRVKNIKIMDKMVGLISCGNIVLLVLLFFLSSYIIPFFIKENALDISLYFNMFLILLIVSVPTDLLGFPYLGVLGYVNEVTRTTIMATIVYLIGIVVLSLIKEISIGSLICLLIISTLFCLLQRLFYIRKARRRLCTSF